MDLIFQLCRLVGALILLAMVCLGGVRFLVWSFRAFLNELGR